MRLTNEEKDLIARRAGGEYAVDDRVRRIVSTHKKNHNVVDDVFLSFARLIQGRSWPWPEYQKRAGLVVSLRPVLWSNSLGVKSSVKQSVKQKASGVRKRAAGAILELLSS